MSSSHPNRHGIHKLSPEELDDQIQNRIERVVDELQQGFNFLKNCDGQKTCTGTVTFFGSARTPESDEEYQQAKRLASKISKETGYAVITGGGPGIMGAGNQGAFEAGGNSIGMTIKLPMEQTTNPFVTHEQSFKYFFTRKVCMTYAAEAYLYFPGGFGTMDELFEILTLVQTGKIAKVPIILVNEKFWRPLEGFIKDTMLAGGKISPEDLDLFTITDNEDLIVDIVKKAPMRWAD